MTRAAFSCDIARSTLGSTTSPAFTDLRPQARARIFSTVVILYVRRLGWPWARLSNDFLVALVLGLDFFLGQVVVLQGAVVLEAHKIGELLERGDPLGLTRENAGGRLLQGGEKGHERFVRHHDG